MSRAPRHNAGADSLRAAAAVLAGAGVVVGSLVGTAATMLARSAVTPARRAKTPVRVHEVALDSNDAGSGTITLQRTTESEPSGSYTMLWDEDRGRAVLGETITADVDTVTRRFTAAQGSDTVSYTHLTLPTNREV